MLRIGGRSHATGAIPVVQGVVERVLSFHHLFPGKSKWKLRVGNELRDTHHLYMGLWRFLYNENFYYFPEGALEVCPYLHGISVSPNKPLSNSWRQRRQWRIGSALSLAPGCLNDRWSDSMALPSADSCSNSKFRTYNSRKPTLDNMRERWRISN